MIDYRSVGSLFLAGILSGCTLAPNSIVPADPPLNAARCDKPGSVPEALDQLALLTSNRHLTASQVMGLGPAGTIHWYKVLEGRRVMTKGVFDHILSEMEMHPAELALENCGRYFGGYDSPYRECVDRNEQAT